MTKPFTCHDIATKPNSDPVLCCDKGCVRRIKANVVARHPGRPLDSFLCYRHDREIKKAMRNRRP